VAYDVFRNRDAPKYEGHGYSLASNEALFVTRSDTTYIGTVVGGFRARKRKSVD
jgi:hypothetical protein